MTYSPIRENVERVASDVVDAAVAFHRALGPRLLESVYEVCFCHELTKRGRSLKRQQGVPVVYDGIALDQGFTLDVMVDDVVICELKAVDDLHPRATAQLLTYLRLTGTRLGILLNFGKSTMKDGIKRIVV